MRLLIALLLLQSSAQVCVQTVMRFDSPEPGEFYQPSGRDLSSALASGDLNGDLRPDLIVANRALHSITVLPNNGYGFFSVKGSYATGQYPVCVALGYLDEDSTLDLVVSNSGSNTVSVFPGNGDCTFGTRTDYRVGKFPCSAAIADINGDRSADIVVANRFSGTVSILLATRNGEFKSRTDFETDRLPRSVSVTDQNRDGKPDILVTSEFRRTVSVLPGVGDGTFRLAYLYGKADLATIALHDLNGDSLLDAVSTHQDGNTVSVKLASGFELTGPSADYTTGQGLSSVATGDLNNDSLLDLVIVNRGRYPSLTGSATVLIGRGKGGFEAIGTYTTGSGSHSPVVADIDGDGNLDIVVANSCFDFGGSLSVLMGKGSGAFSPKVDLFTGNYLIWIDFGDDADNSPDSQPPPSKGAK